MPFKSDVPDAIRSAGNPSAIEPAPQTARLPLSPRRRRLRLTVMLLSIAAVFGVAIGLAVLLWNRTEPYQPGEASAEVTSELSRGLPPDAPKPRFSDVTPAAGLSTFRTFAGNRTSQLPEDMGPGAAWGDYDNDGDDDLFLVSAGGAMNLPSSQWTACELYENLGDGTFRKVAGFPEIRIAGMAAAWGDYDGDGWLDLVVTGYNALLLFRNEPGERGRQFVRETRFPDRPGFWAGASWGDFDNDRNLDLYICGYIQYVPNETDQNRASQQFGTLVPYTLNPASYEAAKNLLFRNNGDGAFTEVAEQLGVTNPTGRSLAALWHDFDDDGWLDLYVANDISDNVFYRNVGGRFEEISHRAWVADYRSAMGLAAGDWNRDGDDDLFVTHWVAQENAFYDNLLADFRQRGSPVSPPTNAPNGAPAPDKKPELRFMDIADMKGLGQIALPYVGWGTEFVDLDGDGWLDLVVANGNTLEFEGTPKRLKPQEPFLFWNRSGEHFYNLAPLNSALSERHVSRGLAVSDFDNDGAMDILLVHLGEGVQLLRNEMQTGNWLKIRLRSRLANGAELGFGDGAKVIAHLAEASLRRTVSSVSYLSQSSRVLHFGLGQASQVEKLEVRWLGGGTNYFTQLAANATWEITEDNPIPKRIEPPQRAAPKPAGTSGSVAARGQPQDARAAVVEFWSKQRAAMNALVVEKDIPKATQLFYQALRLDPQHEDSRYYLSICLVDQGDIPGALSQLAELTRINPQSHRGFRQWGNVRAIFARSDADLEAAEKSLEKAHAINPEETGALLVLGEVALLRGDHRKSEERLAAACRSNPRAAGGFFLRAYVAWKRSDDKAARALLDETRAALGPEWQPKGSTSEGDVKQKQHVEKTPLSRFWEDWNGEAAPASAFAALDSHLSRR